MVNSGVGESRETATFEQTRADTLNETFAKFFIVCSKTKRDFLISSATILFGLFSRDASFESTKYHGLKGCIPGPVSLFYTNIILLLHFLFSFSAHMPVGTRRYTSSLFLTLDSTP